MAEFQEFMKTDKDDYYQSVEDSRKNSILAPITTTFEHSQRKISSPCISMTKLDSSTPFRQQRINSMPFVRHLSHPANHLTSKT